MLPDIQQLQSKETVSSIPHLPGGRKKKKKKRMSETRCQKVHVRKNTSYLQNTSSTSYLM